MTQQHDPHRTESTSAADPASALPEETRREIRRRIILSRETAIGLVAVLVCAAVCVGLGRWQYGRFEEKRETAAIVQANYDADPVALGDVLSSSDAPLSADDEWKVVELHGGYCSDPSCVLYVRNRTYNSTVGFLQLVPFTADDGAQILVVRGWVASDEEGGVPTDPPAVPDGEITVTVRMRPAEAVLSQRSNPEGQVQTITPTEVADLVPGLGDQLVTSAYGELATEDRAGERPTPLSAPDTSLGNHLSYTFQWWIFALFFPGALIYRTRRAIQDAQEDALDAAARDRGASGDLGNSPGDGGARDRTARSGPVASGMPQGPDGAERSEGTEEPSQEDARTDGGDPSRGTGTAEGAAPAPRPRHDRSGRPRRRPAARARGIDEEEEDAIIDQTQR